MSEPGETFRPAAPTPFLLLKKRLYRPFVGGRGANRLVRTIAPPLERLCSGLEAIPFGSAPPRYPATFILGFPRAGTTLVYQALAHAYDFAICPQLTDVFPAAPVALTWLARSLCGRYRSSFTSHYGEEAGANSPAEGRMWHAWFDKYRFYPPATLPRAARADLARFVGRMERLCDAPFLAKHLRHNQRSGALARALPGTRFLVVLRDPLDVACSLFRGRSEVAGSLDTWLSNSIRRPVDPRAMSPAEQIALQLAETVRDLAADVLTVGPEAFRVLFYEDFVARPAPILREFVAELRRAGAPVRDALPLPARFPLSPRRHAGLSPDRYEAVERAVRDHFGADRELELPCPVLGREPGRRKLLAGPSHSD